MSTWYRIRRDGSCGTRDAVAGVCDAAASRDDGGKAAIMPADAEGEKDSRYEAAQKLISFGELTQKNVEQLRKLNLAVFPVKYSDKFYTDLSSNPVQLYTHLAYFTDIMVGAICCRVESQDGAAFKVYIMTIGVLAPYRRLGIGKQLLQKVLEACSLQPDCVEIYLHVQVGNDSAVDFYKGFGFEVGSIVKDYYTRLDVNDAHIISKRPPFLSTS
jgi:N-alpha-acetyltransferase 50